MRQRGKWRLEKHSLGVGDLVLLVRENLPTNKWPLDKCKKN